MTPANRRYTPEADAEFVALWEAGLSLNEIAAKVGIAKSTAGQWRERLSLGERVGIKPKPADHDRICELWKQGKAASEIAAILNDGRTRNAIIGIVYRAGLSGQDRGRKDVVLRRTLSSYSRVQVTFTAEMDADLRKLAGEGISRATAARRMKVSDSRIRDRIAALNLQWTEPKSAASNPWAKPSTNLRRSDAERQAATEAGQLLLANATDEAGPTAVRLLDRRTFAQCAWPVGTATGADQLCCGERIAEGHTGIRQSYCAGHGMRAVSRTFIKAPEVPRERVAAPVPRREPANDDLWDVAA